MSFKPKGIITAMVTPFEENGKLDEEGVKELVRFQVGGKVDGIFLSGSCGESWALSKEEIERLLRIAVEEADGKLDVYAGTGAPSTREAVELMKIADDVGVDACIVVSPYFVKVNNEEHSDYFKLIADKVDLPIIVYNNPHRTGVSIGPRMLLTLAEEYSNIVGIKEASGDVTKTLEFIQMCRDKVAILAGTDSLIYATLMHGGVGAVVVASNLSPRLAVQLYESFKKGDYEGALDCQCKIATIRNLSFGTTPLGSHPCVIKEAMMLAGLPAGYCRAPLRPLTSESKAKLREALLNLKLL